MLEANYFLKHDQPQDRKPNLLPVPASRLIPVDLREF